MFWSWNASLSNVISYCSRFSILWSSKKQYYHFTLLGQSWVKFSRMMIEVGLIKIVGGLCFMHFYLTWNFLGLVTFFCLLLCFIHSPLIHHWPSCWSLHQIGYSISLALSSIHFSLSLSLLLALSLFLTFFKLLKLDTKLDHFRPFFISSIT